MIEDKCNLVLSKMRQLVLVITIGIGCLIFSGSNLADEAILPPDHGYVLILLKLSSRERVDEFAVSDVDTNEVVRIYTRSFEPAGLNAWMALVAVPNGRYFLGEYQPKYGMTNAEVQTLPTRHRREAADSGSDIFEIVSGAVNYIGDWTLRVDLSRRAMLTTTVEFDKSTLERYVTQFPKIANKYNIYLSPLGEKAISLDDLAKAAE